jgi:hypothetical protein
LTLAASLSASTASAEAGVLDEVKKNFGSNSPLVDIGLSKADSVLQHLHGQDSQSTPKHGAALKSLSSRGATLKKGTPLAFVPQS